MAKTMIPEEKYMAKTMSPEEKYDFGQTIGSGSFGVVYAAMERTTGKECAIKTVNVAYVDQKTGKTKKDSRMTKLVKAEVDTWRAVGAHPNVVELMGTFQRRGTCHYTWYMAMERCDCTVGQRLNADRKMSKVVLAGILRGMLQGIQACHDADIVHRDVKLENFLMGGPNGDLVKLCDFGLAARMPVIGGLVGECGTAPMMSPEMLNGEEYDMLTDVWSFGSMAYLMLFRELPYVPTEMKSKAAKAAIRDGKPPRWLQGVPRQQDKAAVGLLRLALERHPLKRGTAKECLDHPFFEHAPKTPAGKVDTTSTLSLVTALSELSASSTASDPSNCGSELSPTTTLPPSSR
jgi:serine/threonine protein kinase